MNKFTGIICGLIILMTLWGVLTVQKKVQIYTERYIAKIDQISQTK